MSPPTATALMDQPHLRAQHERAPTNHVLQALVTEAAATVPALRGHMVPTANVRPWYGEPALEAVYRFWMTRHAEAGPHHAALQGWGHLVWQPIYLAVIAAHFAEAQVWLDRVALTVQDGSIDGYRIGEHQPTQDDEAGRLHFGAAQLSEGIARLLPAWQVHAPVHPKAARRTCADCVLAALLAVARRRSWPHARTQATGLQWLQAMGLAGESSFLAYRKANGTPALALTRKVCCLHFKCRDGQRCTTCPQRPLDDRLARLKEM